ncbi:MAG: MFS transporter [Ancrocorticia sp.]|uniref:MFS transporter n=1 Tax=Ancrocorticia sp. TaxID=2593684 RepID=UPI003F8E2E34
MTATPTRAYPSAQMRHARIATSALFFTNGAIFANLVPRYPEIKAALDIDNTMYGFAVAAWPVGAIISGLTAAALIRRAGSARLAVLGSVGTALAAVGAGLSPSYALLVACLLLGGAMDAITDVSQTAQALTVQKQYPRSIFNSFHATWSVGAATGGLMSAGAIAIHLPIGIHLTISGTVWALVALATHRFCIPKAAERDLQQDSASAAGESKISLRTVFVLGALVIIGMAGAVGEDSGSSWAALYLRTELGAPASLAGLGFTALVAAQFVGRATGDRLNDRFGVRTVTRAGALLTAVGMGLALIFPTVPGTLIGFATIGLGQATIIPAAMEQADRIPGLKTGTGLTIVTWLLRLGSLAAPPLVGAIADTIGIRYGLIIVPALSILVVTVAGVLPKRSLAHPES